MGYVPLEKLLDKADNSVYKLVVMASKRAIEIAEGQPPLVKETDSLQPSTIALEEIARAKVKLKKNK
ncbi:MAG: DNA-directed RNA polymerase subunit omega [Candidatus Omnitrophica bacterium]|nr:DNA-directed RNA polymerase subunit omega [Candidatus Omnitrophota bacterium]MCM8799156.1 DNA-directed RNA polymerase subunit omega [Candidatus Omnitrophota bacterium]